MEILPTIIDNFQKFEKAYDSKNLRESIDFNVFNFIESVFWIDEPKHSRIIAFLLNPEEIHGQRETFLYLFLEMLAIKDFRKNKWNVYAEKGSVDILITSNYPDKKTIVIENKSNWAVDQDCQMYRYWYQNIFKNNNEDIEASFNSDNSRVIYLSPSEYKVYSENSITRPDSGYEDYLVKMLDEKIISTWYFHIELKEWLLKCATDAGSERLKLFIEDYIQFWEKTNNKEKTIMQELQNYFKDKEQDWKDFVEASRYIEKLKSVWFESFSQELKSVCVGEWKFDKESNDFRWYLSDWYNSLCFVYESHKGLTLWKSQFGSRKKEFEETFKKLFEKDFDLEDDGSSNYIMSLKNQPHIFEEHSELFNWTIGNNPKIILNVIQPILSKYLQKQEVVDFFKKVNNEITT